MNNVHEIRTCFSDRKHEYYYRLLMVVYNRRLPCLAVSLAPLSHTGIQGILVKNVGTVGRVHSCVGIPMAPHRPTVGK